MLCPKCGGTMKIISFLTEHAVVDRVIDHLKLTFVADRPPPPPPLLFTGDLPVQAWRLRAGPRPWKNGVGAILRDTYLIPENEVNVPV